MSVTITKHTETIRILTIDHPPVNAMDQATSVALLEAVGEASAAPKVRVIIVTGEGKCFVAGADLNELAACNSQTAISGGDHLRMALAALRNSPKAVIAAINGPAMGGGLELAMSCDMRVAAEKAILGLPEVRLGVLPGAGGTQLLPRLVGLGRALEMMTTGQSVDAKEALAIGLIDRLAAKSALDDAICLAEKIAANAPLAVASIKATTYATLSLPLADGLSKEKVEFAKLCDTEDKKTGVAAFKARQKAIFAGR
ncbi:MAG: enoyl-CoA hydratase/isomerase family protein [Desulfobulbaceae bacterium]|jgi:enoyl-CoA hydratase/carnithine racemase|nr:enoyl-CoA hydratase/isomerase family protein [Desulfobulbaceae bacterium]